MADNNESTTLGRIVQWMRQRFRRTILMTLGLDLLREPINPLRILGMLTFISFLILGITGILLQVYFQPDFINSYDSVARITHEIPYGFEIRNIHYYASNMMIILALVHLFYLFFKRQYRLHNELVWVMGMITGLLTLGEAYTGYVLVMNTRAMLAVNIGSGILGSISPDLSVLLVGNSYTDLILRMQTLHSILLPVVIIFLAVFHFPRSLRIDLPSIAGLVGIMFICGGLAPSVLGSKFVASAPTEITIPEWYLSGVYALLRTGIPVYLAGFLIPFIYVFILTIIPFYDKETENTQRRSLVLAMGLASIAYAVVVTMWGLRGGGLLNSISSESDLAISPTVFYTSMIAIFVIILTLVLYGRRRTEMRGSAQLKESSNITPTGRSTPRVSSNLALSVLAMVVAVQTILAVQSLLVGLQNLHELAMIESGLTMLCLALTIHIVRVANRNTTQVFK